MEKRLDFGVSAGTEGDREWSTRSLPVGWGVLLDIVASRSTVGITGVTGVTGVTGETEPLAKGASPSSGVVTRTGRSVAEPGRGWVPLAGGTGRLSKMVCRRMSDSLPTLPRRRRKGMAIGSCVRRNPSGTACMEGGPWGIGCVQLL